MASHVVLIVLTIGISVVIHYFRCMRPSAEVRMRATRWRRAPNVHDARNGEEAKLVGFPRSLADQAPLLAPISGRPCVDVRVLVFERSKPETGDDDAVETCVDIASASVPFAVEDARGAAAVAGTLGSVASKRSTVYIPAPTPELAAFFRRSREGIHADANAPTSGPERRYEEHALLVDTEIAVLGIRIPHEPHSPVSEASAVAVAAGYRDAAMTKPTPSASPAYALEATDVTRSLREVFRRGRLEIDGDELGDIFPTLILTGLALFLASAAIEHLLR